MSITNINKEQENGDTFEQLVVLFITVSSLVGPISMLSVSMDQAWPFVLMAITWTLGAIVGVSEFVISETV